VELFEQIRREYEHGTGTIKGAARKFRVHRRTVREALGSATPRERKKAKREKWKLAAVIPWIDSILDLGGHLKTGHRGSPKIRPMGRAGMAHGKGVSSMRRTTPCSFPIALVDVGVTGPGRRCPVVEGSSWIEPRHP